jgi:hypothetical protein
MTGDFVVQAWYEKSPVLEYSGNPLIEAMPPILTEEEAAERLAFIPPMPEEERDLPKEIRLHCVNRLAHLIQPLPIHLELEAAVSSVLRGGYVGRNPMDSGTWRHLHAQSSGNSSRAMFNSTASTFSLVGLSGMGKTTALKSVLRLYPQVIRHTRYSGRDFIHTQIVWLKLECPFDGSLSGLCRAFFQAVDSALGDDGYAQYYASNRQMTVTNLISGMERVAKTYFVGALFIDELQHLKSAKTGGKDNMLNFFVNLVNSIGIPVIFIGTTSMVRLFSDILRNARRVSGLGIFDFKQPDQNDASWELMLDAMWQYQWVKQPVPLTENLKHRIYDLTQGVTDFLGKLMILGQRYAIQSGLEKLDVKVFEHVAATKMKLLLPAIAALRSGKPEQMAKFEDLLPTDVQLEEMMRDEIVVVSDRVSVLRRHQRNSPCLNHTMDSPPAGAVATPIESKAAELPIQDTESEVVKYPGRQTAQEVMQPPRQRAIPLSAKLADQPDPLALLRASQWIQEDPFEFAPMYQVV